MDAIFDISAEEVPIFLAEADDQLQILDEGLVVLEREEENAALLQSLFRAAHTLKGSAGMIGHKRMVELTHTLEAAFDGLRKSVLTVSVEMIDACLQAVDVLRSLCQEVSSGMISEVDIAPAVERLAAVAGKKSPSTPRQTATPAAAVSTNGGIQAESGEVVISAHISPDSIASAARAFQIMMTLQDLGQIVSMQPSQEQIESATPVQKFSARFIPGRPLEEILAGLKLISEVDRLEVGGLGIDLTAKPAKQETRQADTVKQRERKDFRLGKFLVDSGLITETQLQEAIRQQARSDGPHLPMGQILVQMKLISQEVLDEIVAEQAEVKENSQQVQDARVERARSKGAEKTVRTSVERLDNLMNLVGELITDRNRLNLIRSGLEARFHGEEQIDAISDTIVHVGRITDQLQAEVMGIRMLPISAVFNKFPRLVRDLARKANKQVDLVMRGEETELDRSVIEEISDPLIHLLRNSVDHGLETPEERLAQGKNERGIILLTARHEQGRIILTVEDDGRGIDLERVKTKAVEKGLIAKADADGMTPEEAIELIFASGLSTARVVSDVSGRGVGMDIVRNNIERLNGQILVETWPGKGTQFQIVLPLTLAIVPTLLVRVGVGTYAIPLVTVTETLRVPLADIHSVKGKPVIVLRDHVLPVCRLSQIFGIAAKSNGADASGMEYIVVVRSGKTQMGLIVDSLVGEEEVVVKSLSSIVGDINGVSSAAILGDGQVALILDVQGLYKLINAQQSNGRK